MAPNHLLTVGEEGELLQLEVLQGCSLTLCRAAVQNVKCHHFLAALTPTQPPTTDHPTDQPANPLRIAHHGLGFFDDGHLLDSFNPGNWADHTGQDFVGNHASPYIDYTAIHMWPVSGVRRGARNAVGEAEPGGRGAG